MRQFLRGFLCALILVLSLHPGPAVAQTATAASAPAEANAGDPSSAAGVTETRPADETRKTPTWEPARSKFAVWGFVQVQGNDAALGSANATEVPIHNGLGPFPAFTSGEFRRIRATFAGPLTANSDWDFQYAYDGGVPTLRDLYARFILSPTMNLTAGQFKSRFGNEGLRSDMTLNTIERSDANQAIYQDRDIGMSLRGKNQSLIWDVGLYNGQQQIVEGGLDPRIAMAHLLVDQKSLVYGGSVEIGRFDSQGKTLPVRRYGLEARYFHKPWTFEAEYLWSQGFNFFSKADTPASGGLVSAVYRFNKVLDGVVSFDTFDPDTSSVDLKKSNNAKNARNRLLFGINVYQNRATDARWMLNYEIHSQTEGPALNDSGWRSRYQVPW